VGGTGMMGEPTPTGIDGVVGVDPLAFQEHAK
jgi:hypothetical protein